MSGYAVCAECGVFMNCDEIDAAYIIERDEWTCGPCVRERKTMSIVEVYECDECHVRSDQGPDDGLPEGWAENIDAMSFCKECLLRKPLDAHECDNDMCCYGRTG